jgi:hypothetical protein
LNWSIDEDLMTINGITDIGRFSFTKAMPFGLVVTEKK